MRTARSSSASACSCIWTSTRGALRRRRATRSTSNCSTARTAGNSFNPAAICCTPALMRKARSCCFPTAPASSGEKTGWRVMPHSKAPSWTSFLRARNRPSSRGLRRKQLSRLSASIQMLWIMRLPSCSPKGSQNRMPHDWHGPPWSRSSRSSCGRRTARSERRNRRPGCQPSHEPNVLTRFSRSLWRLTRNTPTGIGWSMRG